MRVYLIMFEDIYGYDEIECSKVFDFDEKYKNFKIKSCYCYRKNCIVSKYGNINVISCYYCNNTEIEDYNSDNNSNNMITMIIEFLNMKIKEDIELITICFNAGNTVDFYHYIITNSGIDNKYKIEDINNINIDKLNYLYKNYNYKFVIMKAILYSDKKKKNIKSANS